MAVVDNHAAPGDGVLVGLRAAIGAQLLEQALVVEVCLVFVNVGQLLDTIFQRVNPAHGFFLLLAVVPHRHVFCKLTQTPGHSGYRHCLPLEVPFQQPQCLQAVPLHGASLLRRALGDCLHMLRQAVLHVVSKLVVDEWGRAHSTLRLALVALFLRVSL